MKQLALVSLLLLSIWTMAQEIPKGLAVQAKAPDFSAKDQTSTIVNLKDQLKKGKRGTRILPGTVVALL